MIFGFIVKIFYKIFEKYSQIFKLIYEIFYIMIHEKNQNSITQLLYHSF